MFFPVVAILLLAGRVLAFNITLGAYTLQANETLTIPTTSIPSECVANVTAAQQAINNCNNDPACLCKPELIQGLRTTQQCMFTQIIAKNQKPMDMRVGSTPFMAAYAKSCNNLNQNVTPPAILLTVPDNWDGPLDIILPVGGVAFVVFIGAFLGVSALLLLSNL